MKFTAIVLSLLFTQVSYAVTTASLEYTCALSAQKKSHKNEEQEVVRSGTLTLDETQLKGKPVCIFSKKFATYCLQFMRWHSVNDIAFIAFYAKNVSRSGDVKKYQSISNGRFANEAYFEMPVKSKAPYFKKGSIKCNFSNVEYN